MVSKCLPKCTQAQTKQHTAQTAVMACTRNIRNGQTQVRTTNTEQVSFDYQQDWTQNLKRQNLQKHKERTTE